MRGSKSVSLLDPCSGHTGEGLWHNERLLLHKSEVPTRPRQQHPLDISCDALVSTNTHDSGISG